MVLVYKNLQNWLGDFGQGQMLVNIPYMEHMGIPETSWNISKLYIYIYTYIDYGFPESLMNFGTIIKAPFVSKFQIQCANKMDLNNLNIMNKSPST